MNMSDEEREAILKNNTRHQFFIKRLEQLGMYDKDSDYNGAIGRAVEGLSAEFASYGHSGSSAVLTLRLFNMLMAEYSHVEV